MTDTPTRILEAAWTLVTERETVDVTVGEIAAAAGVSRQLVYFHFGDRAGLLTAMARHRDEASGFVDEVAASRTMPPAEGLEHLLRAWCDYMPHDRVRRARARGASTGDDGGSAWRQRMGELRAALLRSPWTAWNWRPAGRWTRPPTGRGRGSSPPPGSTWSASAAGGPTSTPSARCGHCWPS